MIQLKPVIKVYTLYLTGRYFFNRGTRFTTFFNKYFRCCFCFQKPHTDDDVTTTGYQVWVKIPSHIRVILLKIIYGIGVNLLQHDSIGYCPDTTLDIAIAQYARSLIILDNSCIVDNVFHATGVNITISEPDHILALNIIRKCFSLDKINFVPALIQPSVVKGQFADPVHKYVNGSIHTRAVLKTRSIHVVNISQIISLSYCSIAEWHSVNHEPFLTTESFHLWHGCFSLETKSSKKHLHVKPTPLRNVHDSVKARLLSSSILGANYQQTLYLLRHPPLDTCHEVCHRLVLPSKPDIVRSSYRLEICYDKKLFVTFSFNYTRRSSLDIIVENEQARFIFVMIARTWMLLACSYDAENRIVKETRKVTHDTCWLLYHLYKSICGLMYFVFFNMDHQSATMHVHFSEERSTTLALRQSFASSVRSNITSLRNDISIPIVCQADESIILPENNPAELVFIDTDDFDDDMNSLGAPISGEWQNILCLSTSYHDLGQHSRVLAPIGPPDNSTIPDHLMMLDAILPTDFQMISMTDLYPVFLLNKQVTLGKGAYGEVLLNRLDYSDGPLVAVKSCFISSDKSEHFLDELSVTLEARVLMLLSRKSKLFPFVYGICEKSSFESKKRIVIEYVGHPERFKSVTLFKAITFKDPPLTLSESLNIALDIAEGVQIMQEHGLIHNDIATRNILLYHNGERWSAKITDFGSVCHVKAPFDFFKLNETHESVRKSMIAAHREYAPELHFQNSPPTFKSDIHSLGVMLLDMGSRLRMRPLYEIGKKCTHVDPDRRPVINDIVDMLANTINTL
ncbi:uncharacterized protein [Antedon mediterranea]|uniref:uncharacterized protein n=1 Tax=Antedon mediterranea TaxID=105859 RepID=UPI003AF8E0BD